MGVGKQYKMCRTCEAGKIECQEGAGERSQALKPLEPLRATELDICQLLESHLSTSTCPGKDLRLSGRCCFPLLALL